MVSCLVLSLRYFRCDCLLLCHTARSIFLDREIIMQLLSIKERKCFIKIALIKIVKRLTLIFQFRSKPCVQRVIQNHSCIRGAMILYNCLVIQLIYGKHVRRELFKKRKSKTMLCTLFQNLPDLAFL